MVDRRFLNVSLTVLGVADAPEGTPVAGTQYIVGTTPTGAFEGKTAGSIARYDGTKWKFTAPKAGTLEVLNSATGQILRYDGSAWSVVASTGGGSASITTETHTLTAEEVSAKSFTLTGTPAAGTVSLSIQGLIQTEGTDYSISGGTISWTDKELANVGLMAGDIFVIQYQVGA